MNGATEIDNELIPETGEKAEEDQAWVSIVTPFSREELREFLNDIERLYRINPMLIFEHWLKIDDNHYQIQVNNLSNNKQVKTDLYVEPSADYVIVSYSEGIRASTCFRIEPGENSQATLVITDDYSNLSFEARQARIDEVDKSLVNWGNALFEYFRLWKRWSRFPGWQFYMRRIWQPMKPAARRITYILLMITLAEFVLFAAVLTIFVFELDKYIG